MKLYAARHGETTFNAEGRILGSTPGELTDNGINQAKELAGHIRAIGLEKVYSSDLARTKATAQIVAEAVPGLVVKYTDQLRERNFGSLEGQLKSEVDWGGFWSLPPDSAEYGAESLDDFTRRIAKFVVDLSNEKASAIGVFSHGGVMNRLNYLSEPSEFKPIEYPNGDVVKFDYEKILENSKKLVS